MKINMIYVHLILGLSFIYLKTQAIDCLHEFVREQLSE